MKQGKNLLYLLFTLVVLPACAGLMYSAEPMEARIVDAETQQPLEGVIVVAHWQLERGTPGGSVPAGQLMVMETVTDKQGRFAFPGFAPKLAVTSHLVNEDPGLLLFKSGYRYQALTNEYSGDIVLRTRLVRRSEWNGKTIEMKPFKGTGKEYAEHLSFLHTSIRSILSGNECEWKKMPRLMIAIDKQEKIFRSKGIYSPLYSIDDLPNSKCGSPKEFMQELMQ